METKGLKERVRAGEITAQQAMDDLKSRAQGNSIQDVTKTPTYRWLKGRGAK